MAGGTALWGLEGKPLMPMVNATGSLILLFRLKSRVDFHGSTRVEALSLLGMPQRNPEIHSALERKPEFPDSNPDEAPGPGRDCRGIPRDPSRICVETRHP